MDEKDKWLIEYVINEQEGNTTNPVCTTSEMDVRYVMAEKFGISLNWAYELIRKIVARHPQLHLEKVMIEWGDNKGRVHPEWELTWRESL